MHALVHGSMGELQNEQRTSLESIWIWKAFKLSKWLSTSACWPAFATCRNEACNANLCRVFEQLPQNATSHLRNSGTFSCKLSWLQWYQESVGHLEPLCANRMAADFDAFHTRHPHSCSNRILFESCLSLCYGRILTRAFISKASLLEGSDSGFMPVTSCCTLINIQISWQGITGSTYTHAKGFKLFNIA